MLVKLISRKLRELLAGQGRRVALHPLAFLLVPLILTTLLSYGFMFLPKLSKNGQLLDLYFPERGLSKTGKERIMGSFGTTFRSELNPINGLTFTAVLTANGSDILRSPDFFEEYLRLRDLLEEFRVWYNDGWYSYAQLCYPNPATGSGCIPDFIRLLTGRRGILGYEDVRFLTFPDTSLKPLFGDAATETIKVPLGGVAPGFGYIREARGALMNFHFPYRSPGMVQSWENGFRIRLRAWKARSNLKISWFTMSQFQEDLGSTSKELHQLMPCLLLVIIVFCMGTCCVADWVHSKPLVAFGGVVTALISCLSGFGALLLCQVRVVDIVYVAPFLILSIGVDDMFLLLAAWRKTSMTLGVVERMEETYGEAAVSITITSITDVFSFLIGAFSVFPAVRYFCLYTAACIGFNYLYQISMFAAILAFSGRREEQNRHCFFFHQLKTATQARREKKNFWYRVFCTGGDGVDLPGTLDSNRAEVLRCSVSPREGLFHTFFHRFYAPMLSFKPAQAFIAVTYLCYLGFAIYGTTTVQVGMNYAELLPDQTPSSQYFVDVRRYFLHYTPPLEVLLPSRVRWEDEEVQRQALALARTLENSEFTGPATFWLREFLPFAAARSPRLIPDSFEDRKIHPFRTLREFYELLNEFLDQPTYRAFRDHLRFDPLSGQILHARLLVSVKAIDYGREWKFLDQVKEALEESGLNATAHHASFQLGEQQAAVLPSTLQTVGVATGAMLIIAVILIPKLACSVCLALCILSTNLGVLGYMALWGVRLDIVSMITILMSIGISVDFVAHISYFYVQALELDLPVSKAERALQYLGVPILQGGTSTVLGMLVLLGVRAYMIRAFVKTLLLVILFGLYHGLVLLPLILSLLIKDKERKRLSQESSSDGRPRTCSSSGPILVARTPKRRISTVSHIGGTLGTRLTAEEPRFLPARELTIPRPSVRPSSSAFGASRSEPAVHSHWLAERGIVPEGSHRVLNWLLQSPTEVPPPRTGHLRTGNNGRSSPKLLL